MADDERPPGDAAPARARWKGPARVAFSLVLLLLIALRLDLRGTLVVLGRAAPLWVVAMLLSMVLERFWSAFRWWVLMRVHDPELPFAIAVRGIFVSGIYGMFLPGGGTDVVRVVLMNRRGHGLSLAFGSVAIDRIVGLLTLLLVAIAGCAFADVWMPDRMVPWVWAAVAAMAVATTALWSNRARAMVRRALPVAVWSRVEPRVQRISQYLKSLSGRPALLVQTLALGFGIQIVRVFSVILGAEALAVEAPFAAWFAFVPLTVIAQLLPVGIGGLGVREAAFVFFLGTVGVPRESAFALSLLAYLVAVLSSLPGLWLTAKPSRPETAARADR